MPNNERSLSAKEARRQLKRQCELLEGEVEAEGLASPEALANIQPGGAENPDTGLWGWIRYAQHLLLLNNRVGGINSAIAAPDDVLAASVDRNYLATMACKPELVVLDQKGSDGRSRLHVYPKSLGALLDIHDRDVLIGALLERIRGFQDTADQLQLHSNAWEHVLFQQNLIIWSVTTDGPRPPYNPESQDRPTIPGYIEDLSPSDHLRILKAHQRVNNLRLAGLQAMFDLRDRTDSEQRDFRFSVFVGSLAEKLGVSAEELMWDWSYAQLLAQAAVSSSAQRESYEKAEDDAKRNRRRTKDGDTD